MQKGAYDKVTVKPTCWRVLSYTAYKNNKTMKKLVIISLLLIAFGCKDKSKNSNQSEKTITESKDSTKTDSSSITTKISDELTGKPITLTLKNANKLAKLPLDCINTEYPNKLGQTLTSESELAPPKKLHPAFYGCFDWHSSVHAHWSLVSLLKQFPKLKQADKIKSKLEEDLSKENIAQEVLYFKKESSKSYERTYGWAWLLKLAEEIHTWNDSLAKPLEKNLQPLTNVIVNNFETFLPKLNHPIRVGEHENTAFAMVFAYDYAESTGNEKLKKLIKAKANGFYLQDDNCPIGWEPSGFDFLSPCLEEVDIMERVLSKDAFKLWLKDFMPQLMDTDFDMPVAEVSDRKDGKLVHLDGLNFSRAWVFYDLANKFKSLKHLKALGDKHMQHSFDHIVNGDSYEGGHWLGTYAIYALNRRDAENN